MDTLLKDICGANGISVVDYGTRIMDFTFYCGY